MIQEVTLGLRTSFGYQYFKLVCCFDAFGGGDNAETAAKTDYRRRIARLSLFFAMSPMND